MGNVCLKLFSIPGGVNELDIILRILYYLSSGRHFVKRSNLYNNKSSLYRALLFLITDSDLKTARW